jgi:predicted ribosome quality control (RQC) complex YloA/Tae2 family protein
MTRSTLVKIASHLSQYRKINAIERVEDTIVKIVFDRENAYYFDMRRGDAYIFQTPSYKKVRNYNAPFDVVLKKRFNNAKIEKIEVPEGNRILRFVVNSSSKYKAQKSILQFEFTGRNTNIIILDEEGVILEAYRHIDAHTSFREVKVGVKLLELPPRPFKESDEKIEDIAAYLHEAFQKREKQKIESLKKQKLQTVQKKLKKLQKIYDQLEDEAKLMQKSEKLVEEGNLLLSNLHLMKNYQKEITLTDFSGNERTIQLPQKSRTPAEAANDFFKRAKKFKQKAKSTHIERENLASKINFLKNLQQAIASATSLDALKLYLPKQPKQQKKEKKQDSNIETFFIEGYKIMLGKNEKGNISLLKSAKMSDIWMHLKDIPSTHVIIRNEKKSPPFEVLEFAAKLCVQFSDVQSGSYLVDFTQRRNVKMREGANVNYVNYDTIKVTKE